MKHMDYSFFDSKDGSIASYKHLMNLFGEFIVFRCKRKRFRHDSELLQNGGSQVYGASFRKRRFCVEMYVVRLSGTATARNRSDNGAS